MSREPPTKHDLRRHASALPHPTAEESHRIVEHLYRHLSDRLPETVVTHLALPDECDLAPLIDRLPGWRWLYPRVPDDHPEELTLHDHGGPLERHRLGMEQPTASAPVVAPIHVDVALVPGILFSSDGTRLGRGTGHYDRLLSQIPERAEKIGVTIDARIDERIPRDTHDIPMTGIVTETGLRSLN